MVRLYYWHLLVCLVHLYYLHLKHLKALLLASSGLFGIIIIHVWYHIILTVLTRRLAPARGLARTVPGGVPALHARFPSVPTTKS